jgi:hypothetical protein
MILEGPERLTESIDVCLSRMACRYLAYPMKMEKTTDVCTEGRQAPWLLIVGDAFVEGDRRVAGALRGRKKG